MNINEFFKEETDRLYYMQVKNIGEHPLIEETPLPIVKDDFMENIKEGNFDEEIDMVHFVKGMIFNISIDPDFKYNKKYVTILNEISDDINGLIFGMGMHQMTIDYDAVHFFRANYILGDRQMLNTFFYGALLMEMTTEPEILREILKMMNDLIRRDDENPLGYIGLGSLEIMVQNFHKATLYFDKALELLDKWDAPEEVRDTMRTMTLKRLNSIRFDSELQMAAMDIERGAVIEGLKRLRRMDNDKSGAVKYQLGKGELKRGYTEKAQEYFREAYQLGCRELSFYIDASYTESQMGNIEKSMELLDEGLEKYVDDENLLYNRAMLYMGLGENDKAIDDLTTLVSYDDVNENIYNQAMVNLQYLTRRK